MEEAHYLDNILHSCPLSFVQFVYDVVGLEVYDAVDIGHAHVDDYMAALIPIHLNFHGEIALAWEVLLGLGDRQDEDDDDDDIDPEVHCNCSYYSNSRYYVRLDVLDEAELFCSAVPKR